MKIRPYKSSDFDEIKNWINNEREHALWCANLIHYPLEKHSFEKTFKEFSLKNNDIPFSVITDEGKLVGFFCYGINSNTKEGKLKFIIISPAFRGKGYGQEMVSLAIKNIFTSTKAESVELNVFSCHVKAKNCYLRVGFLLRSCIGKAFRFNDEVWARCNMVIKRSVLK